MRCSSASNYQISCTFILCKRLSFRECIVRRIESVRWTCTKSRAQYPLERSLRNDTSEITPRWGRKAGDQIEENRPLRLTRTGEIGTGPLDEIASTKPNRWYAVISLNRPKHGSVRKEFAARCGDSWISKGHSVFEFRASGCHEILLQTARIESRSSRRRWFYSTR